jgi:uracil phosphoribosyltransferase
MAANNVHILSHPLVNTKLAVLRDVNTSAKDFREGIRDLTYMVAIEASRDLEEQTVKGVSNWQRDSDAVRRLTISHWFD